MHAFSIPSNVLTKIYFQTKDTIFSNNLEIKHFFFIILYLQK